MKNQLSEIVSELLKGNNISFDKNELEFQIQSHPSYPSLHAVTSVLTHFNIENVAAQLSTSTETLKQLPNCFVAQIKDTSGQNLVTVKKGKKNLTIYDGAKKTISILKEEFVQKFTGIIVAVEKNENKQFTNTISNFSKIAYFVFLATLFFYFSYNLAITPFTFLHLLLSLIGIIISVAIIKQEIGIQTTIGNAFCSGANEKKDCDAVLTSKGAALFYGYKLSDFSLLYFSMLLLLTFILGTNPTFVFTISFISIPITIYSIYYQYAVVKKWCLLCLTIVGVLWLQAIVALFSKNYTLIITPKELIILLLTLGFVFVSWKYLKPFIIEIHTLRKEKVKAAKFQRNYNIFESLLHKSIALDTNIDEAGEIVFGNIEAKLELVVITNPFCGHCKPVHKIIETIIAEFNTEVKILIRFNVNTDTSDSDVLKITTRLLEIYTTNKKNCFDAMTDIYNGMAVKSWLQKWEHCKEKERFETILKEEKKWCIKNNINFTPELLINGKSYPKEYDKSHLHYFIEDLIENIT